MLAEHPLGAPQHHDSAPHGCYFGAVMWAPLKVLSQYPNFNSVATCAKAYKSLRFVRWSIPSSTSIVRFHLYLSLVRSKLTYCYQLWRPYLIKDIISLECVQRRATKFVLNDYSSNYKARLISLKLLPLMYWFELQDILLLVKCMKEPAENFDISTCVSLSHQIPEHQVL